MNWLKRLVLRWLFSDVSAVKVLSLKPGDALLLTLNYFATQEQAYRIKQSWEGLFEGTGNKVAVINGDSATVSIVRKAGEE